ncbi:MAG: methylmalonyl-CoA mutase [Proteobacteria bacterium]|nr:methylmalonyl-CoA mutase [Pseudomonadota bacterium]
MLNQEMLEELSRIQQSYDSSLSRIMEKAGVGEEAMTTFSGLSIKPLYTPLDVIDSGYLEDVGFPGQYPYTRGTFAGGYLGRGLHIRQVTGLGTAVETNQRWKFLIARGADALSVVPDDGSGHRADSDDDRVRGLVGNCGVALDTVDDFRTLFDGIDIRKYTVHLITSNAYALACYLVIAGEKGIDFLDLRGSMSNFIRPEIESLDIAEFCARNVPLFNHGYLDMRNVREGGCTAVQEIAFGVALAMAGAEELIKRGLHIDDFLHRVTWFVNAGPEFFEEVAKFRAMRRVWSRVFYERYGARKPGSLQCRMHCQTYAPTATKAQPFNNLIRSALHALSAVLGGVQSLHVNSFDEALAIPTEFSAALSVRTQQIIGLESGVTKVIDPMGGSYYVESLTNTLEKDALALIDKIQDLGGAFKAWDWMCQEIRTAAIKNQQEFDSGKRPLVGVNTLVEEDDIQLKAFRILNEHADFSTLSEYSPEYAEKQNQRLRRFREERDPDRLAEKRAVLIQAMQAGENMIPSLMEAVKAGLTRGEFARIKGEVFNMPAGGPYECSPPMVLA